jgi:tripartite-type tricarboxylate transporter receptor subunit TctC
MYWTPQKVMGTPDVTWRLTQLSSEEDAMLKRSMLVLALTLASTMTNARALDYWPTQPLRVVVPFAPGSAVDVVPRTVFEQLSKQIGQPIVVENRGGAGGTIGTQQVARSQPNGYTLLVTTSAHTIAPAIYANLAYDPAKELIPVTPLGVTPSVLVVPASKEFGAVADLVAAARAAPGKLTYASAGIGSATHFSAVRFMASTSTQAVHVPFKGGSEIITELLAARIDFFFGPVGVLRPHIESGKLKALAVNTGARSPLLPKVPTLAEAGIINAEYPFWIAMFAPAATPQQIVEKLRRETLIALESATVREKLAALGVQPMPIAPVEFAALIQHEITLNRQLAEAAGVKAQ